MYRCYYSPTLYVLYLIAVAMLFVVMAMSYSPAAEGVYRDATSLAQFLIISAILLIQLSARRRRIAAPRPLWYSLAVLVFLAGLLVSVEFQQPLLALLLGAGVLGYLIWRWPRNVHKRRKRRGVNTG